MTDRSLPRRSVLARHLTDPYLRGGQHVCYTPISHVTLVYSKDGLSPRDRVEFGVNVFLIQGLSACPYQLLLTYQTLRFDVEL